MTDKQKRHIIATLGTLLFLLLLFLLLWFVYISAPQEVEEEGVEVAFGEVEDAGGYMPQESEAVPLPSEAAAPSQPSAPSDNDLLTQEDEESLALKRQREQEEKARQLAEAERLQREKEEQARLEKERIAKEKALAEQRAKEEAARQKAFELTKGFGQGNGSGQGNTGNSGNKGSGTGVGEGIQGNPVGHGSLGGHVYSLDGRTPKSIPDPEGYYNENAKVVVQIRVNANGDVISAKWTTGTQNASQAIIKMAENAAMKSKWDAKSGANDQIGTITYIFKVN